MMIVAGIVGVAILFWLRRDMKKQREWREKKERAIAIKRAKIASKNKQKEE